MVRSFARGVTTLQTGRPRVSSGVKSEIRVIATLGRMGSTHALVSANGRAWPAGVTMGVGTNNRSSSESSAGLSAPHAHPMSPKAQQAIDADARRRGPTDRRCQLMEA
jgi:hypothetical protein